ncbi:three-Cys-motif partner protein TcmP [Burkholderia pseudomultivorans]|uniref:three-Cys-motif partner protein TcmP n=1 Tax=Burkholderia pseudomultivorans TaxID=1207504 RepID=UPI000AD46D0E|nr:three-Cys-motif partner protein TcmP [Burkholderia pseudomultivorans]
MPSPVPDLYEGRIPAMVKHALLKNYLEKLVLIIGMSARSKGRVEICYVDCFAGPWGSEDEKLEGTSISLSLKTLAACKEKLASLGVDARMRALFIERDRAAFQRLSKYLSNDAPNSVEAVPLEGDFVNLRADILNWAGEDAFTFFFIDPKGWTPIVIDVLRPLLQRPRSEFLINFIYEFINRTASIAQFRDDMRRLLGKEVEVEGKTPEERELALVGAYREALKTCVPFAHPPFNARTAYVTVMHPQRERTKYHLVYLSCHPKGIVEFMNISQAVDIVQARVRLVTRLAEQVAKSGTMDMFLEHAVTEVDGVRSSPEEVDRFWIDYLGKGNKRIDQAAFADILETTNWLPRELQASLARLIKSGAVVNLDAIGKKRSAKPLHFEGAGETLSMTQEVSDGSREGS